MLKSRTDIITPSQLAPQRTPTSQAPTLSVAVNERRVVHAASVGNITLLSVTADQLAPSGHNADFQVALPLVGLFGWKVGRLAAIIDANTVLFQTPGQEYEEDHPVAGQGHASLLVDPSQHIVEELRALCAARGSDPFQSMTRAATPRAQAMAHHLAWRSRTSGDRADELVVEFLLELASVDARPPRVTKSIVDRAKRYIHALGGRPLALESAAAEIGVSPIYLTQAFKAAEGVPLYRYHLNLRLSQALALLPAYESITELALELGFSSHSHFSAAFFARFDMSPSDYRRLARRDGYARRARLNRTSV